MLRESSERGSKIHNVRIPHGVDFTSARNYPLPRAYILGVGRIFHPSHLTSTLSSRVNAGSDVKHFNIEGKTNLGAHKGQPGIYPVPRRNIYYEACNATE